MCLRIAKLRLHAWTIVVRERCSLEDVVGKLIYIRQATQYDHFCSNILNKIEDMSDRDEDYTETFLSELENYDYTINCKKVVISVVKH